MKKLSAIFVALLLVAATAVTAFAAGINSSEQAVLDELKKLGREDIIVVAGGVIPAQDYDFLYKAGVAAILGPVTSIQYSAIKMLEIFNNEDE